MMGLKMKNKTKEVKIYGVENKDTYWSNAKNGDDIDRLVWFISQLSPHNLWKGREAVEGLLTKHTEQIKKEDKRSAKQFDLACRAIDGIYEIADMETEKILRKYFKDVDKLNKQYLEKGQNE